MAMGKGVYGYWPCFFFSDITWFEMFLSQWRVTEKTERVSAVYLFWVDVDYIKMYFFFFLYDPIDFFGWDQRSMIDCLFYKLMMISVSANDLLVISRSHQVSDYLTIDWLCFHLINFWVFCSKFLVKNDDGSCLLSRLCWLDASVHRFSRCVRNDCNAIAHTHPLHVDQTHRFDARILSWHHTFFVLFFFSPRLTTKNDREKNFDLFDSFYFYFFQNKVHHCFNRRHDWWMRCSPNQILNDCYRTNKKKRDGRKTVSIVTGCCFGNRSNHSIRFTLISAASFSSNNRVHFYTCVNNILSTVD